MRSLIVLLLALCTCACTDYKYTETPKAIGPWTQANADPDTRDNNIVSAGDVDDAR